MESVQVVFTRHAEFTGSGGMAGGWQGPNSKQAGKAGMQGCRESRDAGIAGLLPQQLGALFAPHGGTASATAVTRRDRIFNFTDGVWTGGHHVGATVRPRQQAAIFLLIGGRTCKWGNYWVGG
jgi:hypothetical protein